MNKEQLVSRVAEQTGLSKQQTRDILDAMLETIQDALQTGSVVSLRGFGSFEVVTRPGRTGRNPKTGEELQIAAKNTVRFKASKTLKDLVKGTDAE